MSGDREAFVARYGGVYEHSPWVAEAVWPPASRDVGSLHAAMKAVVDAADEATKLALIRAHPDLAGRAAESGALTSASREEQTGAGLDRLDEARRARLRTLNQAYKAKFGFPFIIAVRGLDADAVLAAMERRLDHDRATEFATALAEIHKIARLRLEAMEDLA